MKSIITLVVLLSSALLCQCQSASCRTNCSKNGTVDEQCWREALVYRSSELVERLFSFASLAVHVETFRQHHQREFNDSVKFIDEALQNHLNNESKDALLNVSLFADTKQLLLNACQNLTSKPVTYVAELPPLSCSARTCSGDLMNYLTLFIIGSVVTGLIVIICLVQLSRTRRRTPIMVTVQQNTPVRTPSSSTHLNLNQ